MARESICFLNLTYIEQRVKKQKVQKKPEMELKSFSSHFQEGTVGCKKTDLFTILQLITVDVV
jgi:hypothetical protein